MTKKQFIAKRKAFWVNFIEWDKKHSTTPMKHPYKYIDRMDRPDFSEYKSYAEHWAKFEEIEKAFM